MKQISRRALLLGMAVGTGCTRYRRPRLNVFNWSAYVAPETIAGFEERTGVRVRYAIYESNEEMLAKVLSGNSGWDVVFPTHYYIRPMREAGLLAQLNHEWLPNLRHLDAAFAAPVWDPAVEVSVPYMWGATGIVYNPQVQPEPQSWADLWSPRYSGRLTMLDDPAEVLGAALKKLGYGLNETEPSRLYAARDEAIRQKQLLRAYLNAEVRDQLVAGDVMAAQLWATTAQQAIEAAPHLRFVYPREGFPLYSDCAVVLRESGRERLAHEFINYLLEPRVAASIVESTRTATVNASARALLPPDISGNPTLYPSPDVLARGEWFAPLPPEAQRLRDRLWTEIRSA